jgi:hypothetical protein
MIATKELQGMTRQEKLQTMEALWDDLSSSDAVIDSPDWHLTELHETEERVSSGAETPMAWEMVKTLLRARFA